MRLPYAVLGRSHKSSTGIADPGTLTVPDGARAFMISTSASALLTLDGTAPATNVGLLIPTGFLPFPIPTVGSAVKVAGNGAAAEIEVVWLG